MSVVEVRAGTTADVAAIRDLEREVFGVDAWSVQAIEQELTAQGRRSLVAVDAERLVGYAVTWTVGEVADLQRVVVASQARRLGVGGRLVSGLVEDARRRGADRVLLEVSAANRTALAWYAGLGFARIDRRPAYYRDGSDALVLQLALTPDPTEETP